MLVVLAPQVIIVLYQHGVLHGSIFGPFLLMKYINDHLLGINTNSKPMLTADDTGVLNTANKLNYLQIRSAQILNYVSKLLGLQ
jgi:hypothetical protein